jgi:hypothetical protein
MYVTSSEHSTYVAQQSKANVNADYVSFDDALAEMSENGEISFDKSDLDTTKTGLLNSELILPSMANVAKLTEGMNELMDNLYKENGISKNPPVELSYSYADNKVKVIGNREDAAEIEELINSDPEMKEYTRTYLAISETAMAIQESIKFQEEYRNSNNPEAVVAKYAYLFNDNKVNAKASYMYGSEPALLSDGQVYSELYDFINSGGDA